MNSFKNIQLKVLNENFHQKKIASDDFYIQLKKHGIDYNKSILITIFPDGLDSYCGELIAQDEKYYKFDINLDNKCESSIEDITSEISRRLKAGSIEKIAFIMLKELIEKK